MVRSLLAWSSMMASRSLSSDSTQLILTWKRSLLEKSCCQRCIWASMWFHHARKLTNEQRTCHRVVKGINMKSWLHSRSVSFYQNTEGDWKVEVRSAAVAVSVCCVVAATPGLPPPSSARESAAFQLWQYIQTAWSAAEKSVVNDGRISTLLLWIEYKMWERCMKKKKRAQIDKYGWASERQSSLTSASSKASGPSISSVSKSKTKDSPMGWMSTETVGGAWILLSQVSKHPVGSRG